jgi:hypothetical protein
METLVNYPSLIVVLSMYNEEAQVEGIGNSQRK